MSGKINEEDKAFKDFGKNLSEANSTLNVTTLAMTVWAAVVTLALAAMVVLVFRRLRKGGVTWSSKTDAESAVGSSEVSSEKSSVIDLNDAQAIARDGLHNECFDAESVQVDYHHKEVDFDTVDGLYDDGTYGDEGSEVSDQPPSFSRAITTGQGSNAQNLRGLFLPDSKSTF